MEATMAIETRLARVAYDQVKLRDISANYHKMTYAQFCDEFPGIDWGNTFLLGGFPTSNTSTCRSRSPSMRWRRSWLTRRSTT